MHEVRPENRESYTVDPEPPISISHLVHTLSAYRSAILLGLLATTVAYVITAVALFVLSPSRQTTTLPFRLIFEGASSGVYPNGRKFSPAEITASPILLKVFNDNGLQDFTDYATFSRSIFVLEANREYERLVSEYQARLTDPRLTTVDRERLAQEFEMKQASLSKSDYSINFVGADHTRRIPPSLVEKTLRDTLATWAEDATVRKQVLLYSVPVLSANILEATAPDTHGPIIAAVMLRNRVKNLVINIEAIRKIPGTIIARTSKTRASLDEIELRLEDAIRFKIEPLISAANVGGLIASREGTLRILEAQLFFDRSRLRSARARELALRDTLAAYEKHQYVQAPSASGTAATQTPLDSRETVMPQMSDTFLDRLMALVNDNADRKYRQGLVNEIGSASLAVVPAEEAVVYDEHLVALVRSGGDGEKIDEQTFRGRWSDALATVTTAIGEINEIYTMASRQLHPATELYTIPSPSRHKIDRAVSWRRLALIGIVVILIAVPLLIAVALIHNRVRQEEKIEAHLSVRNTASTP